MNYVKKALAVSLSAGMAVSLLGGCTTKVKTEDYSKTVVATYGNKDIYLDEVNYYLKSLQDQINGYFFYYQYFYSISSKKDMFAMDDDSDGKNLWEDTKEDAMAAVYQTYVLCDKANEYGVSLTEDDREKINVTVDDFINNKTDLSVTLDMSEERLKEILERNAIANKVYTYLVKDNDTSVNDADFRHTKVSYILVKEKETTEETTAAETTEEASTAEGGTETAAETTAAETTADETTAAAEKFDAKAKADEILEKWKAEIANPTVTEEETKEDGETKTEDETEAEEDAEEKDPVDAAADNVINSYKDTKVSATYTESKTYGKPEESTDTTEDIDTKLKKYCWNELKKGEFGIVEDDDQAYVIYCKDDDDADGRQSAVDEELENRRKDMFKEKYAEILKSSSKFSVKNKIYSQLKWEELEEAPTESSATEAETTVSETAETETVADTTPAETTAAGESAADTTEAETTIAETTEAETVAEVTEAATEG